MTTAIGQVELVVQKRRKRKFPHSMTLRKKKHDERTLAMPTVRDLVDLGDSPWSDHSSAPMP